MFAETKGGGGRIRANGTDARRTARDFIPPRPTMQIKPKRPDSTNGDGANASEYRKRSVFPLIVVAAIVAVLAILSVWEILILQYESYGRRRLIGRVDELLDAGSVFAGVHLGEPGKDKLVVFSPTLRKYVEMCTLAAENIAAVSPQKTRLLYLSKLPTRMPPDYLFNRRDYWVAMMLFDADSMKLRCVQRGLRGEPLTGGYGMTGVWGGAEDRVFFTMVRKPGFFEQLDGLKWLESMHQPLIVNVVYFLDETIGSDITTLPSEYNIRDVQFFPGETWYASAYFRSAENHLLTMMTDDRHIKVEIGIPDKPHGIFALPDGDIAVIADNRRNPHASGAVYVYDNAKGDIRLVLETRSLIKRARIDNEDGYLFFVQIEDYDPALGEEYVEPEPTFHFVLYRIQFDRLMKRGDAVEEMKPLGMKDLTRVTTINRGGSMGYYDLDIRNQKIYLWNKNAFFEIGYDGTGKQEVWSPPDFKLQWIQILQGDAATKSD